MVGFVDADTDMEYINKIVILAQLDFYKNLIRGSKGFDRVNAQG